MPKPTAGPTIYKSRNFIVRTVIDTDGEHRTVSPIRSYIILTEAEQAQALYEAYQHDRIEALAQEVESINKVLNGIARLVGMTQYAQDHQQPGLGADGEIEMLDLSLP